MNAIKTEKINTNNAWGFGGWSGTRTVYDNGLIHHKGKYSYRHTGTSKKDDWTIKFISDEYPDFDIIVHGLSAKKIATGEPITIYVYRQENSYRATTKPTNKPFDWEGKFELIKTVKINQS